MIRFDGLNEEEYEGWRFWAKAHLRTKTKKDDAGVIENEEELAAELVTLLEPGRQKPSTASSNAGGD